jgi:hypothetical protein
MGLMLDVRTATEIASANSISILSLDWKMRFLARALVLKTVRQGGHIAGPCSKCFLSRDRTLVLRRDPFVPQ